MSKVENVTSLLAFELVYVAMDLSVLPVDLSGRRGISL